MRPLDKMPIPPTWNGEQALDVARFLEELVDTIWHVHGESMARVLQRRDLPPPELAHCDD